jgi:hypothetical protein
MPPNIRRKTPMVRRGTRKGKSGVTGTSENCQRIVYQTDAERRGKMKEKNKDTAPKIKIRKRVFLGEIKLEDYLRKEAELILEKYKNN